MEEQNKKDRIKILITGIVSLILIICIVGYTYSYFVVKDTDNITITGTVASGELEIEVNQLAPTDTYQNKGLIPQLDGAIRNAVVGRNNLNCVDDNYNSVCKVYEVIVTNKSNMSAFLDGYIKLDGRSNPNLKWALIDYDVNSPQTKPELLTEKNSYSEVTMVENVKFGGSGSEEATKKYYVVVWISETEEKQYDTGEFTGEITFEPTKYTSYVLKKSAKITSETEYFLDTPITRDKIHSINFIDTDDIESLLGDESVEVLPNAIYNEGDIPYFDVSILEDDSVKLYYKGYTDTEGNNLYDVMIGTDTGITFASSGYFLFARLTNMENINLDNLDTSMVTNMNAMFSYCVSLESINVSNLDTLNVVNMSAMFASIPTGLNTDVMSLTEIVGLKNFNTKNVINMSIMFQGCIGLTDLEVSGFDTSKVTDMRWLFSICTGLTSLDLSSFETKFVTNMQGMFQHCENLTNLDLSNFDTSKVINMYQMFYKCNKLKNIDLSNFDTKNVTNMTAMFNGCVDLEVLDITNFNVSNVTTMNFMFTNCSKLKTIYASSSFNGNNVLYSVNMFQNCTSLVGGSGTAFDASTVDKTYAKIDGGTSSPGYFTLKNA